MKTTVGSASLSASVMIPDSIFFCRLLSFYFAYSWISWNSAGYIQVLGKKLKWSGNSFWKRLRCIPRVDLRQMLYMPRKWFTFWVLDRLLRNSGDMPESAQNRSQLFGFQSLLIWYFSSSYTYGLEASTLVSGVLLASYVDDSPSRFSSVSP